MDSATYFDMVDQAISEKIYEEAGVVIYGGQPGAMGKPVLVADTHPARNHLRSAVRRDSRHRNPRPRASARTRSNTQENFP